MSIGCNTCNIQSVDDTKAPEEKSTMRACLVQLHWTKHLDPLKNKSIPQRQHFTQPIPPTGRQRAPAPPPFHSAEPLPPSISPKSYIHVLSVYLKRNEPRAAHPKKSGQPPRVPSAPCSHLAPPELDQSTYTVSRPFNPRSGTP